MNIFLNHVTLLSSISKDFDASCSAKIHDQDSIIYTLQKISPIFMITTMQIDDSLNITNVRLFRKIR